MTSPSTSLTFASEHDSLSVRSFTVSERMSALFDLSITAVSRLDDIDFETIIGQPASFRLQPSDGAPARAWSGVCNHFEQLQAEETGLSTYLVKVVPELWLLTQRQNHRIFQHLTVPQCAQKLLDEWKVPYTLTVDAAVYPRLEYRVQYGESDFAFLSRLLEEAGISYFFANDQDHQSRMMLTDKPNGADPRVGGPVPFVESPGMNAARDYVTQVRTAREMRPGAVTLRDFDFRGRLTYPLFGKAGPAEGVEAPLEQYRYAPGAFVTEGRPGAEKAAAADEKEGTALAERGFDAIRTPRKSVSFQTNALDLAPGRVFSVGGHPKTGISAPHPLLVVEQHIDGSTSQTTISARAVLAEMPLRPAPVTPKPRISGVQSAIVVGPKGEEIHTDEHGRVRVQFPWDREGKYDENSSCWVRVSQGWAGAGFGVIALPRVGQEVTVGFFEGDPDQPVVLGRVYDALNHVPYKLPDNKTKSGIRTASSPGAADGTPAYNELVFEDKAGSELVSMRAQRDLQKLVRANETERTGLDRTISVGKNRTATVGAVDTTYVATRHSIIVGGVVGAAGGQSTSVEMTDRKITYTTGEATVAFDGPDILLEAKGNITIVAHEGDVVIRGGPNVKINCD